MEESNVSLAELKVILEKEKAARGELNSEQQYSLSEASLFARVPPDKVPIIVKELMEIPMMSPFNAVKIVDLMPTYLDDVRAIFAKERFSLSKEEAEKVLEIVGKYRSRGDAHGRLRPHPRFPTARSPGPVEVPSGAPRLRTRGGRVQVVRTRAEGRREPLDRTTRVHRERDRDARRGPPREAPRGLRGAHDRGAEGAPVRCPGDGQGEGREVRRFLQPRAGHHDAVPHARAAARPREEDDVGDPRGTQEGAVQVVPGSGSTRPKRAPPGEARREAHRNGDFRSDPEIPALRRSLGRRLPEFRLDLAAVVGRETQLLSQGLEKFPFALLDRTVVERFRGDRTVDASPVFQDLFKDFVLDSLLLLFRNPQVLPQLLDQEVFRRRHPPVLPGRHDGACVIFEPLDALVHRPLAPFVNSLEVFEIELVDVHRLPHDVGESQVDRRRAIDLLERHLLRCTRDLDRNLDLREARLYRHRPLPPARRKVVGEHALLLPFDVRLRLGEEAVAHHFIEVPRQVLSLNARRERDRLLRERLRQDVPLLHVPEIGEVQEDAILRRQGERRVLLHGPGTPGDTDNPSLVSIRGPGRQVLKAGSRWDVRRCSPSRYRLRPPSSGRSSTRTRRPRLRAACASSAGARSSSAGRPAAPFSSDGTP